MIDSSDTPARVPEPATPAALGSWLRSGARTALFLRPDWRGLRATPALVASVVLVSLMLDGLVQRLYIVGPARFYWPALMAGWLPTVVTAWACWLLVPRRDAAAAGVHAPTAMALFALQAVQVVAIGLALALIAVPAVRAGWLAPEVLGRWGAWLTWSVPLAWSLACLALLLWRGSDRSRQLRSLAVGLVCAAVLASQVAEPLRLWYPDEQADGAASAARMQLTQELFEDQAVTLDLRLASIAPQRQGVVDVYAITFAPYADEDVFLRESRMVAGVMADRFDAAGRTVQLVNHRSTLREWPWATPLNLQRTIEHMARRMDRDEDILFLHLTSHGAHAGPLEARFWPLTMEPLTPAVLKAALDAAGIRHRVVSVSACYSGSWLEPLADEHTLVMTAADADHTSYGCGRGADLTYFGRAMFDEQLRKTRSFEDAHAQARRVIEQREKQAGKDDGYSNPQIRVGQAMQQHLRLLESQLSAAPR